MKRFSLAFFALAAALAITPAAVADSWIYTISGSNFSATLDLTGTDAGLEPGPNGSSVDAYLITSVSGTFWDGSETYIIGATTPVPASGANANSLTDADGYLFDNLLYPSLNPVLDWGGLLLELDVDNSDFYLNIFGGAFGGTDGINAPDNTYYYFADNNDYANNLITKTDASPATATLTAAPEPGSLFLLGSGLLGLALVLWRKASRPSCNQILNA